MSSPAKTILTRTMRVTNATGLHARPTSALVRTAIRFKSQITIEFNGRTCAGNSIMDIMTADIRTGSEILVTAAGPDAEKALDAIQDCLASFASKGL